MNLQSVIIHEIVKNEKTTGASLFLTSNMLDVTNTHVQNIINSLDLSFSKKTIRRAKFNDDGFKVSIPDFSNFDMVSSTRTLTETLKTGIAGISAAKGGYLVFCKYQTTRNFFAIFIVRNTTGSLLKQAVEESWEISSTEYLNVDHFAMGVRINLDILASTSDDRYIHLVKGNTDISEYFENWIGIDDTKQETKDGEALYHLSNQIDLPDDVNRDELKKKIFDFVNGKSGKIVNLRELSEYLYGEADTISAYCTDNEIDIDGEFKLAGAQLKRFTKVSISAGGIKLEASRDKFNPNEITISEDNSIVTIHSEALAAAIRDDL